MKILSGIYKGMHIKTSLKQNYRPTQTKVRKSIFDSLGSLEDYSVLDLFSGTGILGFESASRGASSVVFVEKNLFIYKMLKKNAAMFSNNNFKIKRNDSIQFLKNSQSFDLIFADPPYNYFNRNTGIDVDLFINMILDKLNLKGRFIFECPHRINICYPVKTKVFGETKVCVGRKE